MFPSYTRHNFNGPCPEVSDASRLSGQILVGKLIELVGFEHQRAELRRARQIVPNPLAGYTFTGHAELLVRVDHRHIGTARGVDQRRVTCRNARFGQSLLIIRPEKLSPYIKCGTKNFFSAGKIYLYEPMRGKTCRNRKKTRLWCNKNIKTCYNVSH